MSFRERGNIALKPHSVLATCRTIIAAAVIGLAGIADGSAQEQRVVFQTSDPGVEKSIKTWGVDTAWSSLGNMRQALAHMGADEIDTVRICFFVDEPLTDAGELGPKSKKRLDERIEIVRMAGKKPLTMLPATEDFVHAWYKDGKKIRADRWCQVIEATIKYVQQRLNHPPIAVIEPFNEPDYGWGQGSPEDLREILKVMRQDADFKNIKFAGAATLNCDAASRWFNVIKEHVSVGSTHTLAGRFETYVNFIKEVRASGHEASNPEPHSLVETLVGAEYGLQDATWWGAPFRSRGLFVKSSQGKRLVYVEDAKTWSAAAVYRAPDGVIRGFVGGVERQGAPTSYRFVSADRAVYFDGEGPMRDYMVSLEKHGEDAVEIDLGGDVPPALNGRRFVIVNRETGKALELRSKGDSEPAHLALGEANGSAGEKWDVARAQQGNYTIKSAQTGKLATMAAWDAIEDGAPVRVFGEGRAEEPDQWWFEYLGDGWFHIRNRFTCKFMQAKDGEIVQGAGDAGKAQQWRFFPAEYPVDFTAPQAPAGLKATAREAAVRLDWNDSAEGDGANYTVYRSAKAGGPYEPLAATTENHYTDPSASAKTASYYVVRATDHALNHSPLSSEAGATPAGGSALIAHLDFENSLRDSTENGNDAAAHGTPKFVESRGKRGRAILLDGPNDYLALPPAVIHSQDITICAWVKWFGGGWASKPAWQRVFDFGSDSSHCMFLTPHGNTEKLQFSVKNGDQEQQLHGPALKLDEWTHLAVVLAGGTGTLYVNGKAVDTQSITIHPADINTVTKWIGKSTFADPMFRGCIDDFRIYNYAVPPNRVAELGAPEQDQKE